LFAEDMIGAALAMAVMPKADRLRVYLASGVGGPFCYGFGVEVGRA
jgi:hypothetical protein